MKQFYQDEVSSRFQRLPYDVKGVILSDQLANSMLAAMNEANLEDSIRTEFNNQVTLIVVGLATLKDLHEYLRNDLKLEQNVARSVEGIIARDCIDPIFQSLIYSALNPD